MNAHSLLKLSRAELLTNWLDLVVEDEPETIQENDTRGYAIHPDGEFEVVFDGNGFVDTVFVYRESSLLDGLVRFSDSRQELLKQFGKPSLSGQERFDKALGLLGAWDRFDYDDWSLHFQYQPGSVHIKQVTVMTADVARRVSPPKVG
jgi:hypothetical protein